MQIPLVDLKAQYSAIRPDIDRAIQRVLDGTSFILGSEVEEFERAFARHVDAREAVGVGSGTSALHLALLACDVGPGAEVITTAHTFIATAAAISHVGARPVFVDIDPRTYTIDPQQVEEAITPATRALLPVHLYGQPADMSAIAEIARRHDLRLIEDAAQAHGAEWDGRRCGSIGDLACFSFYPGKNLGACGDAGAVTGNDASLLDKVRRLRNHGAVSKYQHDERGFGERLDAFQAAVLGVKLVHLEAWTRARQAHAKSYDELLADCDVVTPYVSPRVRHVYHLYAIRTRRRDALLAELTQRGIQARVHYPVPLHRQPVYRHMGYDRLSRPVTERVADEILSLPLYPELTQEQIAYVSRAVNEGRRLVRRHQNSV
ncbi:MAG: erythromycin biosynthesis sensory transduction protein eryC1 [Candidatus Rokuibacteriota bacterium]|nr:MAG: erythromycin biosynthesis sensory transduction protein eryC1 [Candidatus Rokubacteria bacterium]